MAIQGGGFLAPNPNEIDQLFRPINGLRPARPGGQFVQFGQQSPIPISSDPMPNNNPGAGISPQSPYVNESFVPDNSTFIPLPDPRFGTGGSRIGDPSVQPTLIQNQMFQPPMQQPVQNQMPVANSYLEQLQQSAGLLNGQIRNVVPQNRFVGNQFEMPFNFNNQSGFGSTYNPSNFNYTPQPFNQYGNVPVTGNIPSNVSTTTTMNDREGRSGERGSFGNQDNISTEFVGNRGYRIGGDGRVEELDPESLDYKFNKFAFDALNLAKINPLNPLGYIDNMSQRLDPDIMSQIQGFESANPRSLTYGKGINQAINEVFGSNLQGALTNNPTGGLTETQLQGLINTPSQNLSLPQPTTVADLIDKTQGLNTGGGGGGREGGAGSSGSNRDGTSGCFVKGTMIQMADGTEKEITSINVGEEIKGGVVEAKTEFMPHRVYDYKGIKVSGSHLVMEDDEMVTIENSKHGVLTDIIEPVYVFETSGRRMWINNIEFGDYMTGSDKQWEPHVEAMRQTINREIRDGK